MSCNSGVLSGPPLQRKSSDSFDGAVNRYNLLYPDCTGVTKHNKILLSWDSGAPPNVEANIVVAHICMMQDFSWVTTRSTGRITRLSNKVAGRVPYCCIADQGFVCTEIHYY